ncbi:MAG: acyloxyacyl hydrolase [Bacteroidales bacterium]|nr:acyloxyacyl hydrolase [Bacteroidales bacterium]HUM32812.1 acyloxyacyl hydrolase [Bacteroidales bacterium]
MKTKLSLIALFFTLLLKYSFSQSYNSNFNQFEIKTHYGFTLPHHSLMRYFINNNVAILELNYSIKTDGSKPWQHAWRFPEMGGGYLIGGLGNINVLGFSQSLFWFFGVPIIEKDNFIFKYRIGGGIAYLSEKFDYRANYYNVAIGSHFNAHLHFSIISEYKISNEFPLYLTSGLSYNHFSNGAIETPNLGLNQFSFNIGLKYLYSKFPYNLPKRTVPYVYNKIPEFSVYLASGIKENSTYENKKFTFFSLVADYGYRVSTIRTLGLGINIISDFSLKSQIAEQNLVPNKIDILRIGIHGFQELYFTPDLSMLLQVGTYAFNKFKPSDKTFLVYSKLGLRYTFLERYFVNIVLKTHTTTADYIEFGVGIKIISD